MPADALDKESACPDCRTRLVLKAVGNKVVLVLAGVDGGAPTCSVAGNGAAPPPKPEAKRSAATAPPKHDYRCPGCGSSRRPSISGSNAGCVVPMVLVPAVLLGLFLMWLGVKEFGDRLPGKSLSEYGTMSGTELEPADFPERRKEAAVVGGSIFLAGILTIVLPLLSYPLWSRLLVTTLLNCPSCKKAI
ncbi:MAG: hypothetical protein ACRELF_05440 [Gemmataceae bacterium]